MSDLSNSLNNITRPVLYLVFTVGVPGLGKSSLINKLRSQTQKLPLALETCVSDEVRSGVLAKEYAERKVSPASLSQEEIFKVEIESGPRIKEELNNQIIAKLNNLKNSGSQICLFVLDKNHCAANLVAFVKEQAEQIFQGVRIAKRVILPTLEMDANKTFGPFHFDTIAVGLVRSLGRKGHITMNHGSLHSLLSFVTCLQNHMADNFDAKFPPEEFGRVEGNYFVREKAEEVKNQASLKDQYDRLKQIVELLGKKQAPLAEHADFLCAAASMLAPMSVFPPMEEEHALQFLAQLIQ